jgi:hypothetical protein
MSLRNSKSKVAVTKTNTKKRNTTKLNNKTPQKAMPKKHSISSQKDKKSISKNMSLEKKFKERLELFTATIDSIQKTLETEDKEKVQEILNNIINDITFFLKLLPEIKEPQLLSDYKKVYKKFEKLLETTKIKFEISKTFSVDYQLKNTVIDDQQILFEKVRNNTTNNYFYRKYSDKNTPISVFDSDGSYYEQDQNDSSKYFIRVRTDNFFKIDINQYTNEYDESNSTLIDSISINIHQYESYFRNSKNELHIIELLFENNRLRNALSMMENNKIFDITVNVSNLQPSSDSKSIKMNNNKNLLLDNNTITENNTYNKNENKKLEPVFLSVAFYKPALNLLYAKSGVGKSFLSIAIGMSNAFKKCLYILVDCTNENELSRYDCLANKSKIITLNTLQKRTEEIKQKKKFWADFTIMVLNKQYKENGHYEQYKQYCQAENITKYVYRKMGVEDQSDKIITEIDVLKVLFKDAIDEKIDFICLDSLNGLLKDPRKINRNSIRPIIEMASGNNLTFLCIHHANKKGVIAGSTATLEEFEYVYRLSNETDADVNILPNTDENILFLDEEKARHSKQKSFTIKVKFENDIKPIYELINVNNYIKSKKK